MKIDFSGLHKDVIRLTDSGIQGARVPQDAPGFENLLAGISPDAPKPLENTIKTAEIVKAEPPAIGGRGDAMASLNYPKADMKSPPLTPLGVDMGVLGNVKEQAPDVKAPSVLGIRRYPQKQVGRLNNAEDVARIKTVVDTAGFRHGVDPTLGMAVVSAESAFNPNAVSRDGHASKGLMQLLDSTGQHMLKNAGLQRDYKPFDVSQNIDLGVGYLRRLHDIFSRGAELPNNIVAHAAANSSSLEKLAVAAYNAGEGRVAAAQARAKRAGMDPSEYDNIKAYLPESTQDYVDRVIASKTEFEG